MERYKKFLNRLDVKLRLRIIKALYQLAENDFKGLDIKKLNGEYELYRCRVGKVRILFQKGPGEGNTVLDIGFREDIYKGL